MVISSLRTTAFRNLADELVTVNAKDVFLIGENGQGKTNFLEALYFCAYASSFRGVHDSELARTNQKDFSAIMNSTAGEIMVKFERGKKTVTIDDKKIEDRKELLSVIPCIVFCHEDMEFVAGSPEQQRRFFDQVLSLYDPVYLDDLRCYRRVLKSRNSVLRNYSLHKLDDNPETLLETLDQQCVPYGLRLMEKRQTAAELFSGVFEELYREVSGIAGVQVRYLPSWKSFDPVETADLLRRRRAAELATGISMSGPHRDRYVFAREDKDCMRRVHTSCMYPETNTLPKQPLVDFAATASTGQRRLLALLLRVAQARRFSEMTGRNPILLLDDVLLEMDGEKRRRFIATLPNYNQAFYTFLPEEPFQHYRKADTLVYYVKDGRIEVEEP